MNIFKNPNNLGKQKPKYLYGTLKYSLLNSRDNTCLQENVTIYVKKKNTFLFWSTFIKLQIRIFRN